MIRIGVDFDNTVICYDKVFHAEALRKGLIPEDPPWGKEKLRDYLRGIHKEDAWTELQGHVYGVRIRDAEPFPGVLEFFRFCGQRRIPVSIISHRTRYPYLGPRCDLHHSAYQWLESQGFFDPDNPMISRRQVFFELTKEEKVKRIIRLRCTHFIDDLPEFLCDPLFPGNVIRILFDPNGNHPDGQSIKRLSSWHGIETLFRHQSLQGLARRPGYHQALSESETATFHTLRSPGSGGSF